MASNTQHKAYKDVFKKFDNRFQLSMALAKRAKQLSEGMKPLIDHNSDNDILPIETALQEFMEDKVHIELKEGSTEEEEMLEEMDQILEAEIKEKEEEEEKNQKDKKKDKGKNRKSLGA